MTRSRERCWKDKRRACNRDSPKRKGYRTWGPLAIIVGQPIRVFIIPSLKSPVRTSQCLLPNTLKAKTVKRGVQRLSDWLSCFMTTTERLSVLVRICSLLSDSAKLDDPNHSLLQELRSLTRDPNAQWTCPEQQLAAPVGLTTKSNMMLSMPCGTGKTLAFMLPTLAANTGLSLVIVPYRSLLADMATNMDQGRVKHIVWDSNSRLMFQPGMDNVKKLIDNEVRFISAVEDTVVGSKDSMAFIDMLTEKGLLNNIIIDECHQLIMSRHYRDVHRRLEPLSLLGVPLIFSSGTLPRGFRNMIMRCFHMVPLNTQVVVKGTSFDRRLILDCIQTDTSNVNQFHEEILQIVEYHTTKIKVLNIAL
jgi:DEAD/DEAH box helicase